MAWSGLTKNTIKYTVNKPSASDCRFINSTIFFGDFKDNKMSTVCWLNRETRQGIDVVVIIIRGVISCRMDSASSLENIGFDLLIK